MLESNIFKLISSEWVAPQLVDFQTNNTIFHNAPYHNYIQLQFDAAVSLHPNLKSLVASFTFWTPSNFIEKVVTGL